MFGKCFILKYYFKVFKKYILKDNYYSLPNNIFTILLFNIFLYIYILFFILFYIKYLYKYLEFLNNK